MITAPMARGGMQIKPRFPPTTAVSATPPSSIPLGGQQMPQVFTGSKHVVSGIVQSYTASKGTFTFASNNELAGVTQGVGLFRLWFFMDHFSF